MARKLDRYVCDCCEKKVESDGYPKDWVEVAIRLGSYFHSVDDAPYLLDKDCCSILCAKNVVGDWIDKN